MTASLPPLAAETIEHRIELAGLPHGWFAVLFVPLLVGLLLAVIWLYRREQRAGASFRARAVLTALRCSVMATLAFIWLEPVVAVYIHRRIDAHTLVLVDGSASMSLIDRYPEPEDAQRLNTLLAAASPPAQTPPATAPRGARKGMVSRMDILECILGDHAKGLLARLAAHNPLQVYRFGDCLERIAAEGSSLTADMSMTDLGRGVRGAVEAQAGAPVAAIVVCSDGRFNHGEPPDTIGRYARSRRIPIHAVGVGDPAEPRNVAVVSLDAPPNVFVKDPFSVTARLTAQGVAEQTVNVSLLRGGDGTGSTEPVATRTATVNATGQVEPVVFEQMLSQAAQVRFMVRVVPVDGETLVVDNTREVTVRALDNKMRVLLIAGGPSYEYRYVTNLLVRDATFDVSCWLQSADETAIRDGKTIITELPAMAEKLAPYDCIIMMDPDPEDLTAEWIAAVEAIVANNGSGLLYVAGRANTPRLMHQASLKPLIDLLPVSIDAGEADLLFNEMGTYQVTAWPPGVPAAVANHPVLAMSDQPSENLQTWSRLGGVYWHYPVRRAKPVATVLLQHSNPRMRGHEGGHVLLATQFVGSGRVGFMAFDSTWRWRRSGEQYFNKFWVHLLRHLVEGKLLSGQKRGMIQTDRDAYAVGEAVTLEARLLDEHHLPLDRPEVVMTIRHEGEPDRTANLAPQPNRPGWYRGRFVPLRPGIHGLQVDLPGGTDAGEASVRGEVRVGQADIEFRQTSLDREALRTLASQSAGGEYFDVDEAGRLADLIPNRTVSMVLSGEPMRLWDRWWTLAALVVLLSVEWLVRKRVCLL
ncbi:MAG: VWA domain-containing protein [Phycisphaerae bacterium]|nr:VWA domain-containing protein [Phycisphaerae bacterium]